jgi:hypothetical protein
MPTPSEEIPPGQAEPRPLLFGCLVLLIATLVLGGAFLLGAWSVTQGQAPPSP